MEEKAVVNRAVLGVLLGEYNFAGVAVQSNQEIRSGFSSFRSEAENRLPVYREESASAGYGLGCFLSGKHFHFQELFIRIWYYPLLYG